MSHLSPTFKKKKDSKIMNSINHVGRKLIRKLSQVSTPIPSKKSCKFLYDVIKDDSSINQRSLR